ncbi:hypothetical protein QZH41_019155 [Actinostola sp. cb2023]|nr:hypothetical protein QZH41_019155 [Actinostola sp. cb2023]
MPTLSLFDITNYLLESPRHQDKNFEKFGKERLLRYKTLRSYRLWKEDHINSLQYHDFVPSIALVRCLSLASFEKQGTEYKTFVAISKETRKILYGHCHCVAGLGEACTHVAGLLFAIEEFVSEGLTELPDDLTCTEKLCKWIVPKGPKDGPQLNRVSLAIENYEEMLFNKDGEISALKKTVEEMSLQMEDPSRFTERHGVVQINALKVDLEKHKTLLRETENGEKEMFNALKESKMVIRERDGEIKKLKEFIKTQEDRHASKLDDRKDECNRTSHINECLQRSIKEKDERMAEIRLSLWETQNFCERESKRLKQANEDNVVQKERELSEFKRTFQADKKRFEEEFEKLRRSTLDTLAFKEEELQRLKNAATNFQDAINIDEATIGELRKKLEEKEYELFNMHQSKNQDIQHKSDELEKTKLNLDRKVFSLEKELEKAKDESEDIIREKESRIDELLNVVDKEQCKSSNEMKHRDRVIDDLRREVKKLQREFQNAKEQLAITADKASSSAAAMKHLNDTVTSAQEQNTSLNTIIETIRNDKDKSLQERNAELQSLRQKFSEAKEELSVNKDNKIQLDKLSKETAEKNVQIAVLQKHVSELRHMNENMKGSVSALTSKLDAKTKSLSKATKTSEILESAKKNNEEEITTLKRELEHF